MLQLDWLWPCSQILERVSKNECSSLLGLLSTINDEGKKFYNIDTSCFILSMITLDATEMVVPFIIPLKSVIDKNFCFHEKNVERLKQ